MDTLTRKSPEIEKDLVPYTYTPQSKEVVEDNTICGQGPERTTAPLLQFAHELLNEAKLHNIKVELMIKKIDKFLKEI